jgi:hypothetical protein
MPSRQQNDSEGSTAGRAEPEAKNLNPETLAQSDAFRHWIWRKSAAEF